MRRKEQRRRIYEEHREEKRKMCNIRREGGMGMWEGTRHRQFAFKSDV